MKSRILQLPIHLLLLGSMSASAAIRYVDLNSGSPTTPYTNWATAAKTIQDAVDAAVAGDQILVTNGVYQTGARRMDDGYGTTNRVVVNKPVTVQSVNGAAATLIQGGQIRCVYLTNGAALVGFTLTNGVAAEGGGVWCESASAVVSNCVLIDNGAYDGGGAKGGTLYNCTLRDNLAYGGGGASHCTLFGCIVSGNSASAGTGGGTFEGTLFNCTVTGNSARYGGGARGGTLYNCTLSGNSAGQSGGGTADCRLTNCIVYYNTAPEGGNYSDDTFWSYSCTTPLPTNGVGNLTNAPLFVDYAGGNLRLQSNSPCINAGSNASAPAGPDLDGNPRIAGGTVDLGAYEFQSPQSLISYIRYVNVNNASPTSPYTNWTTAATTIQDAVDAAVAGDQILVTNGVYQTGGRAVDGERNRVAVNKSVTVQSVNGAAVTLIQGNHIMRCVYLTNGAALVGFTLTNGAAGSGGGVLCESSNAVVANCVLTGNGATAGGGASGGTLNNCTVTGNRAEGGGGASGATLNNCTLTANSAYLVGGGAAGATLNNCAVIGNWTDIYGGGGAYGGTLNNCIVYYNGGHQNEANYSEATFISYSCTTPLPTNGIGNLTHAPLFVDSAGGNLRLQSNSPCINSGSNVAAPAGLDLDGNPRIAGGAVDIGAYEFQSPQSLISYAWLQQYGLPTDGSADYTDADADGLNNWQEWRAGTDPTNALSVLRLLSPASGESGLIVSWQSVSNRTYFLERGTELGAQPPFLPLATGLVGQPVTTTFTDTNAIGAGPFFYRVGVQE